MEFLLRLVDLGKEEENKKTIRENHIINTLHQMYRPYKFFERPWTTLDGTVHLIIYSYRIMFPLSQAIAPITTKH